MSGWQQHRAQCDAHARHAQLQLHTRHNPEPGPEQGAKELHRSTQPVGSSALILIAYEGTD